jgi:hypothetical protein
MLTIYHRGPADGSYIFIGLYFPPHRVWLRFGPNEQDRHGSLFCKMPHDLVDPVLVDPSGVPKKGWNVSRSMQEADPFSRRE